MAAQPLPGNRRNERVLNQNANVSYAIPREGSLSTVTTAGVQQRKWQDAYAAIVDR